MEPWVETGIIFGTWASLLVKVTETFSGVFSEIKNYTLCVCVCVCVYVQ
jgi:hypothetical protein